MNEAEYITLKTVSKTRQSISVGELTNLDNRTLLYGHTCDRDTWHVYLFGREIHFYMYGEQWGNIKAYIRKAEILIPNKRLYPECCDFEFCQLLKQKGLHLPFTIFNSKREKQQFYGKLCYDSVY